jgi:hypothetical protein
LGGGKKSISGSGMNNNNQDHISESSGKIFWGCKIFLMRIRNPESFLRTGMEKIRIRDKNPGSATCIYLAI